MLHFPSSLSDKIIDTASNAISPTTESALIAAKVQSAVTAALIQCHYDLRDGFDFHKFTLLQSEVLCRRLSLCPLRVLTEQLGADLPARPPHDPFDHPPGRDIACRNGAKAIPKSLQDRQRQGGVEKFTRLAEVIAHCCPCLEG
jgi:hypothetical protein